MSSDIRLIYLAELHILFSAVLFLSATSFACSFNEASSDISNTMLNISNTTLNISNTTLNISNTTLNISNTTLNIPNTTLNIPNITINNIKAILITHLLNFLKDPLPNLRNALLNIAEIIILCILLALLGLLFAWMSGLIGRGIEVLPFDSDDESKYKGGAIADLLIADLHRINRIHLLPQEGITRENLEMPTLSPVKESLTNGLSNVGSIGTSALTIPIGQLLITLKRLWPIGNRGITISGSLQKCGSEKRLVAHMKSNRTRSWNIIRIERIKDPVGDMISDLAYKIAKDLSPECSAKTWEGLKYFTEALHDFWRYTNTRHINDLENARENCSQAADAEKGYTALFSLFYNMGNAFWDELDWKNAADMFQKAANFKSDFENLSPHPDIYRPYAEYIISNDEAKRLQIIYINNIFSDCHSALGAALKHINRIDEAIDSYENAINLNPENLYPHHNLANVYAMKEDWKKAEYHYKKALNLKPDIITTKLALVSIYLKARDRKYCDEIIKAYCGDISEEELSNEKEYIRAVYYSNCRIDVERAVKLLKIALNKKQTTIQDVESDLDFEYIRSKEQDFILRVKNSQQ